MCVILCHCVLPLDFITTRGRLSWKCLFKVLPSTSTQPRQHNLRANYQYSTMLSFSIATSPVVGVCLCCVVLGVSNSRAPGMVVVIGGDDNTLSMVITITTTSFLLHLRSAAAPDPLTHLWHCQFCGLNYLSPLPSLWSL